MLYKIKGKNHSNDFTVYFTLNNPDLVLRDYMGDIHHYYVIISRKEYEVDKNTYDDLINFLNRNMSM